MGLIERSHEVTFSGVAGTLYPFVTKGEGSMGAQRLQLADGTTILRRGQLVPEGGEGKDRSALSEKEYSPRSG